MTGMLSSPGAVWSAVVLALNLAIILCALLVLPGGRRPQTAMAWLILILALPFLGFLLFLLFGRTTVGKKRRELQVQVNEAILAAAPLADLGEDDDRPPLPPLVEAFTRLNRNLAVLPMTYGNSVELIDDYGACVAAMTSEVALAERFVNVQFYISAWDDVTAPFFE
jgi:cardiolipin synthase A/B